MVIREMLEEPQAKVLGGWNVTMLNEPVQVREKNTEQNDYENLDKVR
jgi:mannose/fructose-specific phosphotransferase system component IIA